MIKPPKIIDTSNLKQDWNNTTIFGGTYGGFQRFDNYRYPWIKRLTELQRSAYWVPSEISLTDDKRKSNLLSENHKEAFRRNLLFQTLADSVQARGLQETLCSYVTDPSAENLFSLWAFFEGAIHSESYSHIVRGLYTDATAFFDSIDQYPEIAHRFDKEAWLYNNADQVYIPDLLLRILFLEGVKFYVSFLITYMINRHNDNALQGVSRIIKLIQRDEATHTAIAGNLLRLGKKAPHELAAKPSDVLAWEQTAHDFARQTVKDELKWWAYLKPLVGDIQILTDKAVSDFVKYRADKTLALAGFKPIYNVGKTELTKVFEDESDISKQAVAGQEAEVIDYNVGRLVNDL